MKAITVSSREQRVEAANRLAAALFPYRVQLIDVQGSVGGGLYVRWRDAADRPVMRRWMTAGNSFYPPWSRTWPGGGTSMVALAQVVRFARSQPVLPLAWWQYVTGEKVALYRDRRDVVLRVLADIDWPSRALCVLCGCDLSSYDWWSLDGVSGPCCRWTEGCRQRINGGAA